MYHFAVLMLLTYFNLWYSLRVCYVFDGWDCCWMSSRCE